MSDQPPQIQHNTRPSYLVSAIVSTYRSAKFIRGRIEDLLNQTIASQIEIIVVDSGSPENEGEIVEEFTTRFPNVRYIRTAQRETIYAAWNRGIETATGKYLTNANTDDRLRRDALETLVRALESNPSKSVAHARQLITCVPNQPFGSTTPIGAHDWPQVTRDNILLNCNVGPQPLWRRNLHTTFGLFDARLEVAGDYDFWIRCCLGGADFILIPEHLGTYYRSPEGANKEFENRFRTFSETYAVQRRGIVKLLEAKSTGDLQSIVNRARVRIDNLLAQPAARPEMSGLQQLEHVFWEASVALEMLKKFNLSRDLARSFFDVVNHSHKLAFHLREIANFSDPTAPAPTGPLVSVIIVCEDCESTLARTLPSVLKQSYRYLELFFISDDSSDEAARLITDFTAKYSAMTLTVLRRPKLHAIAAKNSAATDAKGEFILFLTSGDELASDFINQSIQTLHSNPTVDVVFTEAVLFGAENKIRPANEVTLPALYSINQLPETYLVRRAAFHDAGGFDEGLKYYADWDLWISLAKSGSKFKALQKPLFFSCRKAASHSPDHSCSEASLKAALMSRHPDIYRHPQASDPSSLLDTTKSSTVSNLTQIIRPRPKISFITIVLNGMPFLEASLKSVYKHAHEIIIIEGAVEKCRFAAKPDGSSLDGSVECIQCFPDPERKIRMVQGIWPEKNEMQNKALELVTGEYIWLLDSDEVYREKDIEKVEAILKSDPSITQISFIAHNFWKGFEFIFESKKFKEPGYQYRRVFRFLPGSRFLTHRPPTLSYPGESRTADQIRPIDGTTMLASGIAPFHYSYVTESQVQQKMELYRRYGWNSAWGFDFSVWLRECFHAWTPSNRHEIEKKFPVWTGDKNSYTLRFSGQHPESMRELIGPPRNQGPLEPRGQSRRDLTEIDTSSDFATQLRHLFSKIRPAICIETGTYHGSGTTKIIANAIKDFNIIGARFFSIEVNPANAAIAQRNLESAGLTEHVTVLNGLSVPRNLLPDREEIEQETIESPPRGIHVDHAEDARASLYQRETNFPDVQDDLLGKCLAACRGAPDFLLLDSGGHVGHREFTYAIGLLKSQCYIALDDVFHIKHNKSLLQIQSDDRFELLYLSREKFGFCIARFTPKTQLELNTIRSILWVRPDAIGDAVIAGELLEQIKSRFPSASIVVVCQDRVSPFYENCPAVSSIISFNRNSFSSDSRYAESVVTKLVSARADLALCSVFSRDAICDILMARSGAPTRVGMMGDCSNQSEAQKDVGNKAFTHLIKSVGFSRPEAERHSDFLYALGGARLRLSPKVWLSAEDERSATRFFAETNINPRKTIALFSGAQNAIRKYDKFTESLSDFCQLRGFSVITLGGPQDEVAHTEVCTALSVAGVRCYDLSGKLTLGESAAILKAVALGVGSETGLAHIASAVGTPHVVLLGGGHAGRFMPHSVLTSAVCLPLACFGCNWKCGYSRPHCIRDVHPAVLRRAIEDALHSVSEKPRLYLQGNIFYDQTNGMPDFQFKQGAFNCDLLNIIHVGIVDGTECQRHPELQPDSKTTDRTHRKNLEAPLPSSRKEKYLTFLV